MNYKQFKSVFSDVLLPLGFTNVKEMYFRKTGQVFGIIDIQKSDWGGTYFINIGIYVDEGGHLTQPPPFHKVHLKQRLASIAPKPVGESPLPAFDLEVAMGAAERSAVIKNALVQYGVPYLESLSTLNGIADYLSPEKRNFAGVTLALREIVSRLTRGDASA